jgi:hypothetical protein
MNVLYINGAGWYLHEASNVGYILINVIIPSKIKKR